MSSADHILQLLRDYESHNVTHLADDGSWPIVWDRANGAMVWDVSGKHYLDMTAAFGVATTGHANPFVVAAGKSQLERLPHAMGDVHPHAPKAMLARELSRITFERWHQTQSSRQSGRLAPALKRGKVIFGNSGFEAVEAALKTARLATGKKGIIAFEGAYHGLGYGALNATHRDHFRGAFQDQLASFGHFIGFPLSPSDLSRSVSAIEQQMKETPIGAVLVEPIQGRAGIRVPPPGFLPALRKICRKAGALLILDEIYTGFARTGKWFGCEHVRVIPDLICLGKALTGGFPLSACVGRSDLMDAAWPKSTGEAIHTSTYLGHPVGCAMALAQIEQIRKLRLPQKCAALGHHLQRRLHGGMARVNPRFTFMARGVGLMVGLEILRSDGSPATPETLQVVKSLLHHGFVVLPSGEHGNVIGLTPPLIISKRSLDSFIRTLVCILKTLRPTENPMAGDAPGGTRS